MFGNTSQSACWRHCFRLTAVTLSFFCQNLCHCFSSVLSVVGCGRSLSQNKSPLTSSARSASALVTAPGSSPRRWAPFLDSASKRLLKSLSKWSEKGIATLLMLCEHLDDVLRISESLGLTMWIQPIVRDYSYPQTTLHILLQCLSWGHWCFPWCHQSFDMPGIYQGPSSAMWQWGGHFPGSFWLSEEQ